MDEKPTLDYQKPEKESTSTVIAAGTYFTLSMLLCIVGLVPLYFAVVMTHHLLFEDV